MTTDDLVAELLVIFIVGAPIRKSISLLDVHEKKSVNLLCVIPPKILLLKVKL